MTVTFLEMEALVTVSFLMSLIIGPFCPRKKEQITESVMNDGADEAMAEIYEAMAVINRSFAQITTALYKLEAQGVLGDDYSYHQEVVIREVAAKINCHLLAKVTERELDDRKHYGKMREGLMRRRSRP